MVSRKWFRSHAPWIAAVIVLVVAFAGYFTWRRGAAEPQTVAFSELLTNVDHGTVSELVVSGDRLDMRTARAARSSRGRSEHRSLEMRSGSIGTTRSGKYTELPRVSASRSSAEPGVT